MKKYRVWQEANEFIDVGCDAVVVDAQSCLHCFELGDDGQPKGTKALFKSWSRVECH